ncbi:hypothetical protein [Methylomonas albis]|uniref:Dockerin domain-containing protein n=1 Tax=Methylomonas albis TaxID=1854563 RepID=A0ABR9D1N5_9GAMM|nr:hypothetical protein [Methylomonas albis]MBD9357034.1 hypothetical protein [Methylomonas albis]
MSITSIRPNRPTLLAMMVAMSAFASVATAVTDPNAPLYGSLSNFDVYNDNPPEVEVHGFEIELHGVSKSEIGYSFGAPYQRYGNPLVIDGGIDAQGKAVTRIRYESPYDAGASRFTETTPRAPAVTNTGGHACYLGGPIGNYASSGCEHFGVGVIGTATQTIYRWLVADPATPGNLIPVTNPGTGLPVSASIPAPIWNVQPAQQPDLNPQPEVIAEVEAPELEHPEDKFGPAQWMKVIKTETEQSAKLEHLLFDDPKNPVNDDVNNVVETEIEWEIMQQRNPLFLGGGGKKGGNGGAAVAKQANGGQLQNGKKSVTRRYEFYKYTGTLTVEGEADPQADIDVDANGNPLDAAIGNLQGVQMVAVNLDSDGDGIDDGNDNCIVEPNHHGDVAQRDDDGDGIGNACDAHWANNLGDQVANLVDLRIFKQDFRDAARNPKLDLNEDGRVDLSDLSKFKAMFGKPAGQSGKKICNALNPCLP